jgi:putative ubiquitin-RnfH superfamily antitoxin RatB of RatAB toxin-antitoxin module
MVRVEVVYGPVGGPVDLVSLQLPEGSTVADALRASGVLQRHGLAGDELSVGIWFKRAPLDAPLRDRDRVEIYRPLIVDPKEARRLRYRKRGPGPRGAGRGGPAAAGSNAAASTAAPESVDDPVPSGPALSGSPTR